MSKKKNKEKTISSAASLEGAKDTPETQPTPEQSTPIETPETKEPLTLDKIETPEPTPDPEIAPKQDETPGDDDQDDDDQAPEIPQKILDTFKALPHVKAAYVKGEEWFFDKQIARQILKDFEVIENPYSKE